MFSRLHMVRSVTPIGAVIGILTLVSCAMPAGESEAESVAAQSAAAGATASADLKDAGGQAVAHAELTDTPNGVLIRLTLSNAPAGVRAFHVHQTGRCDGPGFDSAGGHFNPASARHGFANADGPHVGDLPNLHIREGAGAEIEMLVPGATLGTEQTGLLDTDGAALVLHGAADDYRSDPAGNAGPRIACGVVTRSK